MASSPITSWQIDEEEMETVRDFISLSNNGKGFPGGSDGEESTCEAGDLGLIPGSGRSSGEGNGYPLQYSCLETPMDKGAWQATVHRVAKSQIWRND